ncbi:Rieske 2Fe-2S domain-containing protein [Patescibacteria group bacterium]|jgi:nitrite reductase/ring-hydroxylating ferredoxin subunit|nr:Rieske 2Fe-2S domain-containing protein [Patescibacteria group bacterium]
MVIVKKIPVAKVGEVPVGRTKHFQFGVHKGIAFNDQGTLKAYVNACTHMGGTTDLHSSGVLRCRQHFAEFDPATGERLSGQAPEGTRLKPIELLTEGDEIFGKLEIRDEFSF